MNKHYTKIIFFSLLCIACSQYTNEDSKKVQVITLEDKTFKLKVVEIKKLKHINSMQGDEIEILENPIFQYNETQKELTLKTYGKTKIDYKVINDIFYAFDYKSLIMFTLFYNFEVIIDKWLKTFGETYTKIPRIRILYDPQVEYTEGGSYILETETFNASFLIGTSDFIFLKTTENEDLPIKANLAIVAHEFFHLIFDIIFAHQKSEIYDTNTQSNQFVLSAINEGLADFFSWFITEENSSYSYSIKSSALERAIPSKLTLKDIREDVLQKKCKGGYYCEGTILASSLYNISQEAEINKIDLAKIILDSLMTLREVWLDPKNLNNFDFHHLIEAILEKVKIEDRNLYCKHFLQYFNDVRNKDKVVSLCTI